MKKICIIFVLSIAMISLVSCGKKKLYASNYFGTGFGYSTDYGYLKVCLRTDGYYQVVGFNDKIYEQETIIIPQHINGIPVMGVGLVGDLPNVGLFLYSKGGNYNLHTYINFDNPYLDIMPSNPITDSLHMFHFDSNFNELFVSAKKYDVKNVYLASNHVNHLQDFLKCFTGGITQEEHEEYYSKFIDSQINIPIIDRNEYNSYLAFFANADKIIINLSDIDYPKDIYGVAGDISTQIYSIESMEKSKYQRIVDPAKIVISQYLYDDYLTKKEKILNDYIKDKQERFPEKTNEQLYNDFKAYYYPFLSVEEMTIANVEFHYNKIINGEPYHSFGHLTDVYWIDYIKDGCYIMEPPAPYIEGYTFAGWYMDEECITPWDFNNNSILTIKNEHIISLYAKWE